ncbi:MAG: hypothetical protein SGCHY_001037 [Lobulomycetales sp.]
MLPAIAANMDQLCYRDSPKGASGSSAPETKTPTRAGHPRNPSVSSVSSVDDLDAMAKYAAGNGLDIVSMPGDFSLSLAEKLVLTPNTQSLVYWQAICGDQVVTKVACTGRFGVKRQDETEKRARVESRILVDYLDPEEFQTIRVSPMQEKFECYGAVDRFNERFPGTFPSDQTLEEQLECSVQLYLDNFEDFELLSFPHMFTSGFGHFANQRPIPLSFKDHFRGVLKYRRDVTVQPDWFAWGQLIITGLPVYQRKHSKTNLAGIIKLLHGQEFHIASRVRPEIMDEKSGQSTSEDSIKSDSKKKTAAQKREEKKRKRTEQRMRKAQERRFRRHITQFFDLFYRIDWTSDQVEIIVAAFILSAIAGLFLWLVY